MSRLKLFSFLLVSSLWAFTVEPKPVTDTLTTKGKISSHQVEYLHLPFLAKVKPLQSFGHVVKAGEPIFSVEYLSQKETLAHQITEYHQALESFSIATQHISTQQALSEIGALSQKKFLEEKVLYEKAYQELMVKKDSIEKLLKPYGLSIEDIHSIEDTSPEGIGLYVQENVPNLLHAPISGILLPTAQDPHADIFKGHTHIAKIVDNQALEIKLLVSEKQLCKLKEKQPVSIQIPSIQQSFEGYVHTVNTYPHSETGKSQYSVNIRFNTEGKDLSHIYLGMSCILNISLQEKTALLIPLTAIQHMGDKDFVILSQKNKLSGIREVTLGKTYGHEIEVLTGLEAGEDILEHYSNP